MHKRQKYTHNFFIDDEAGHSDDDSEHEGEILRTSISHVYRCPYSQVDSEEVEFDDEDTTHHEPRNTQPSEQDNFDEHWQLFIQRAEARGRKPGFEYDDQESSNLEGWERLWEIGCRVRVFVEFGAISRL